MSTAIIEGACSLLTQESIKAAANKAAEVIVNQGCGAIGAAAIANPVAAAAVVGGAAVGAAGVSVAIYTVANQNKKIEGIRTEYKQEIKEITEKHEQDLKNLKTELQTEHKQNMEEKNAYIKELEAKYEKRMNDIQSRAEEDKIEMKKDLEKKIAKKDIECEFLLNKIVESNKQFANTTNLLIEKINSLEKDMQNQKEISEQLRSEVKELKEDKKKLKEDNQRLETNLQNEKKARQADLEKFQEAKSKDLERRIKFNESQIIETFKIGKENNEAKQIKIQNENKELNPSKNQKQIKENNQKLQNLKEEIIDKPSKRMIFASATEIQKDQIEANEIRDQKEKVNFISDNIEVQEIFCALKIQNNLQERIPVL